VANIARKAGLDAGGAGRGPLGRPAATRVPSGRSALHHEGRAAAQV